MTPLSPPAPVSIAQAFWYWLKLGCISFGGPAGQIAMMHDELVEKRRWISDQRFLHALNYCMVLPGPEATQLAVYIGWLMHRSWGGVMAGVLFVLPSLLLLIGLSWVYMAYGALPLITAIFYGIKPAVVAIVLAAAWRIGSRTCRNVWLLGIAIAAFFSISLLQWPFPFILLSAALLGGLGAQWRPQIFQVGDGHGGKVVARGPALIDDDTPTPAHARFSWMKLLIMAGTGIALGIAVWIALVWQFGLASPFAQMGLFFTKAALLTFGGAYAVLPYVYQGAVEHYHWLQPQQMMDGLALGETTPGPLIMVVAFVGFLGGWGKDSLLLAGVIGACVATFFTFLPSFIFILAGGPLVESTRDNFRLTAPLTAISAAVVGVIVSLALFFAQAIFHLAQPVQSWDWVAILITVAACVALFRYRINTLILIAACAVTGLMVSSLH